jgi:phosphoserine phosphatase
MAARQGASCRPTAAAKPDAATASGRLLIVDMDGTLVRTDTLIIGLLALARHPLRLGRVVWAWRHGRARLKQELAAAAGLDAAGLPYNRELLAFLREQRRAGRELVLATGADRSIAEAVAAHLDLFDAVLASDGVTNLTGRRKLAGIRARFGNAPFTYVGNSRTDLLVWCGAAGGICVNAKPGVLRAAARATAIERSFPAEPGHLRLLLRTLRSQRPA